MHTLLFRCGHLERPPTRGAANVTDALARIAAPYHRASPRLTISRLVSVMTAPTTAARSFSLEKVQSRMPRKQTLQAFLSPQHLRDLAGPKVYARGEEYLANNHVELHEHARDEAIAEVMGSQPYRVELRLTSQGLTADCTCPAMSDYGFCKHAVALGLYLIKAPPPTDKKRTKSRTAESDSFTEKYPNIAGWIKDGWIEIGRNGYSTSIIRVLDEGGLVWEGGTRHKSMDKILQEAEDAIAHWTENN